MGVRIGQHPPLRRVLSFVHHVGKIKVCPSQSRIEAVFGAFGAMPHIYPVDIGQTSIVIDFEMMRTLTVRMSPKDNELGPIRINGAFLCRWKGVRDRNPFIDSNMKLQSVMPDRTDMFGYLLSPFTS
jgi:hypothetical protein